MTNSSNININNHVDSSLNKSGLNTIDDVTLAYMVNTSQYEKYLRKNNIEYDSGFKRDIRFYRKRIISLTKDLFKNQNETDNKQNMDITMVGAFNMYMRACISYLKFSDQSETIQKCYVCLGMADGKNQTNENIKDQKCICKNKNEHDPFELYKANELCFKPKEVKKITLDNYVIRKNAKKSEPVVYPKQFTFNPRDPAFKYKGLKPKPTKPGNVNELKNIENGVNVENGEKFIKDSNDESNEKITNNKKKKKKKKVSFDVTNYNDSI